MLGELGGITEEQKKTLEFSSVWQFIIPTIHTVRQHWAAELRKVCASVNYKKYLYLHNPF